MSSARRLFRAADEGRRTALDKWKNRITGWRLAAISLFAYSFDKGS
jgi:hypothetical protein